MKKKITAVLAVIMAVFMIASVIPTSLTAVYAADDNAKTEFSDVTKTSVSAGAYKAIHWAAEEGIAKGFKDGTFGPEQSTTRLQFVTFLWRLAGKPSVELPEKSPFSDVSESLSAYKAIVWAVENDIIRGFKDGTFGTNEEVKRNQVVIMLWRFVGRSAAESGASFSDVKSSDSAYKAISWAAENNIVKGYSDGTFKPEKNCTRAEIAIFLYRLNRYIEEQKEDEGTLSVGAGNAEIVFDQAMFPVEGFDGSVDTNPYSRVLILVDSESESVVIVSLELVNVPSDVIADIKAEIKEKTGISEDNIWVHANHTITTPHAPSDEAKRALYVEAVESATSVAIDEAVESVQPAKIAVDQTTLDINVNRDIKLQDGWYIGSNPEMYSNKIMTIIKFVDMSGNPIGIYMNYGMKPTTIDNTEMSAGTRKISADLTGQACVALEEKYGCPAMFVMPATGDQQAAKTTTYYEWDEEQNRAVKVELSVAEGIELYRGYGEEMTKAAVELIDSMNEYLEDTTIQSKRTSYSYLNKDETGNVNVAVSAITIGDCIAFAGLKSELNAITEKQLADASPYKYTVVTGFLDGDQKYMPDKDAYPEKTWEWKRSGFAEGCAEKFVEVSLELLNLMSGKTLAGAGNAEIVFDEAMFPVEGFNGTVDTNPYSRVIIIKNTEQIAIVSLELVNVPSDVIASIKAEVAEKAGIPEANVWVHANHTITTPHAPSDETKRELYVKAVTEATSVAIDEAVASIQPVTIGVGTTELDINVNRDIKLKDGWYIGSNPDMYSDKTMTIVRFDGEDGEPVAIYMNYGMKPTTIDNTEMSAGTRKISADLTGMACVELEKEFGCPAMFVMPATGDQQAAKTTTYYEWDEETDKAVKVELSVEEGIALYKGYGQQMTDSAIALVNAITEYPENIEIKAGATSYQYSNKDQTGEVSIDVSGITIGDTIALVGLKSELNAITGHQLAEQSSYKYTNVVGFLNGDQKYMPDKDAYPEKTWEWKRSGFAEGCAERFVEVSIQLLKDIEEGNIGKDDDDDDDKDEVEYEIIKVGGIDWYVIDDQDGRQLLLSVNVLSTMAYDATNGLAQWATSDVRTYLNGDFYTNTFSEEEKARIIETNLVNEANPSYGIAGGEDTTDKIFVLSASEVQKYLEGTDYIAATNTSGEAAWYHVRTPGEELEVQSCVDVNGRLDLHGPHDGANNTEGGIRAAFWYSKF